MAIGGAETSQHQFGGTMTEPINEETTDETGIVDDGNDPAFSPDSGGDVEAPPSDLSEAARSGGDVEFGRSGGDVESPSDGSEGGGS